MATAIIPQIVLGGHVFDPNRHCMICRSNLGVLRMAIFETGLGGLEMRLIPVLHGDEATEDERLCGALAVVDKPGCLKAFMHKWAEAHDKLAN